jgi:hypothetical protein
MNSQEDFLPMENLDAVPWPSQQKEKKGSMSLLHVDLAR